MTFPQLNQPFLLATDASTGDPEGLGAVLSQIHNDGIERVVAYASRSLKPHEKNYSAFLLELAAASWGIDHFDMYSKGKPFTLITDFPRRGNGIHGQPRPGAAMDFRPTRALAQSPKAPRAGCCLRPYNAEKREGRSQVIQLETYTIKPNWPIFPAPIWPSGTFQCLHCDIPAPPRKWTHKSKIHVGGYGS